ncbi:hypothetical protein F2P79_001794 [Pimephales promelas]|nr:hypothetical protein F2P79_001794 [Pimephales promelas]
MSYGFAIREGGNLSFLYQEWSKAPENRPGQREGLKILSLDFGLNPEYSPITGCDIVNGEMGWWWDADLKGSFTTCIFEEANISIEPAVKLSVQCEDDQRGLCGQIEIVYDDMSYFIYLQPQPEPDIDEEGIVINMEEDSGQKLD